MFGVAYFGRGLYYQTLENYTQALNEYRMAIKNDLHPTVKISVKAYMNMGTIYMKLKSYQDAVNVYLKAVKIKPGNGLAHYYLGLAYFKIGDYEKAEKESVEAKSRGVTFTALSDKLAKEGVLREKKPESKAESDK
jgi:tetratricopeptide (TPR) repeat protein